MKRITIYLDNETDKKLTKMLEYYDTYFPFKFSKSKIIQIAIIEKFNKISERKF